MRQKEKDKVVAFLLAQMTYIMLAKSPLKDVVQKAAQKHEAQLKAKLTKEEFEPIGVMRDTIVELARKLVNCDDVITLEHCHAYIQALNEGKVLLAVEDEETGTVVRYEPNQ